MGEIIDFETGKIIETRKTKRENFIGPLKVPQVQQAPQAPQVQQVQHVQLVQIQRTSERTRDSKARNTENQETRRKRRTIKNKPSKQKFNLQGKKKVMTNCRKFCLFPKVRRVDGHVCAFVWQSL